MDKTVAGMIGAVAALSAAIPAEAATDVPVAPDSVMRVQSYADLLRPIPNAAVVLAAMDAAAPAEPPPVAYYEVDDHHHHHHRRYYRRRYSRHHHHHHHHHHASAARIIGRVLDNIAR